MKGSQHPKNDHTLNPSGNESIRDVIGRTDMGRRTFIKTAASASVLAAFGGVSMSGLVRSVSAAPIPPGNGFAGIGFESIPPSLAPVVDQVRVPAGYKAEVLVAWGDPIMPGAQNWLEDATQDAAAQEKQFGTHTDGMHFFPFPTRGGGAAGLSNERGLLCVNHEYTHEDIIHGADGLLGGAGVTIQKVRKSQACHGISVVEVFRPGGQWRVQRGSPYGRRVTGNTPMRISGPAAGHPLMQAKKYEITPSGSVEIGTSDGFSVNGTLNNCAHGYTPWGTYLTCEENWNGYFGTTAAFSATQLESRYGVTASGFGYSWHLADDRFDVRKNPNETNLFGWVVEIDPFDPKSLPVKRTWLGRFKHEGAQVAVSPDEGGVPNRVAFYQGDDERNEYIYKFVCAQPYSPTNRAANRDLLDSGVLYVARFTSTPGAKAGTFRGVWVPLAPDTDSVIDDPAVPGRKLKLRELDNFKSATDDPAEVQALILIKTRMAADAVGATMMDRPEWAGVRTYSDATAYSSERPLEGYCTLTNNNRRGGGGGAPGTSVNSPLGTTAAGSARPPVDLANPRPDNDFGHIIRWREDGNVVTATGFEWDIFVLCGDAATTKTLGPTYSPENFVGGVPGTGPFYQGNIVANPAGSADYGAPDGLWFDQFGRLWVQTDQAGDGAGDFVNIGANVMVCADPNSGQTRRFLTGPPNCEVTGVINTPDGKTMFVGIQHPGEDSTAADPDQFSAWPGSQFATNSAGLPLPNGPNRRPRSSVLVITRTDGGIIGA
jgi:secreted PhoX family phosphatase